MTSRRFLSALALSLASGTLPLVAQGIAHPDHHEFEAALFAPFRSEGSTEARTFKIAFQFPDAKATTFGSWRLELLSPKGEVVRSWYGETLMAHGLGQRSVAWDGRDARGRRLAAGFYTLRLAAAPLTETEYRSATGATAEVRVRGRLATAGSELEMQEQTLMIGSVPAPKMQAHRPLRLGHQDAQQDARSQSRMEALVAAPAGLPYTILLGNMHSQTSHSDGGTAVASCGGAEVPQGGTTGPAGAFEMMRVQAGGDFLLASEHNHMYDGSTSENTSADTVAAKALWQSGADAAAAYRAANPAFLALYGTEWGVISNGGHMNLLNPDGLATWEHGAGGALTGHFEVPKSDYAAMYALMKQRGWVGQFNHPKITTQFIIGGVDLAYDANGAEVMALCEVMNTLAFSTNTTETETGRSFYTATWDKLLERGYKVAPSSDQDNHCANYGLSYTNRTGVLLPTGTPLTVQSFVDAVKARRVFATMDKTGQLVLTANDHIMGETFASSGPLTLTAAYASTSGQTVSRVQFFEGVPGRNGAVTQLFEGADTTTITPVEGDHFYYAVVTQANGDLLWSAPVWVTQSGNPATLGASISAPSVDVTVASGTAVSFVGSAMGTGTLTNAWTFGDGGSATGTSAAHTFTNTGATATALTVTFAVTDATGTATATRLITVNPASTINTTPTLTAPANQSTTDGVAVGPLAFTVGDAESAAATLTVSATSSNPTLLPVSAITLGGTDAARSLSLAPVAGQTGATTVTLTVQDPQGMTTSAAFTLTVDPTPVPGQGGLLISQYYEGAASDKWIELTNTSGASINLASPQRYLALFANAAADAPDGVAPTSSQILSGTLAPGQSLLFKNSAAVNPTYAVGTVSGALSFNGDDLMILTTATGTTAWANRTDVVGNGTTWGADTSLVRKATIPTPNVIYTPSEWTAFMLAAVDGAASETTERLGVHVTTTPASTVTASITTPSADTTSPSGATVVLTGTGTSTAPGATLSYAWAFGDGATGTGASVNHVYTNDTPAYVVRTLTLTVGDGSASTATATRFITVNPAPDTQAPLVAATESGTLGTITLSATASDNRAVSNVTFWVDGVQVGSDATAPYSLSLDSTTLINGSHSLIVKATDAAGNEGVSLPVAFTINNPDIVAPTVTAAEGGTTGTITLSAIASDNVGVTQVAFYVDGVLKGSDTTAPFSMTLEALTLTNGTHSLMAKASDAAGNIGSSTSLPFTISNPIVATERILNGGFESGATSWTQTTGVITSSTTQAAHSGSWKAWLGGKGVINTTYAYQQVAIPGTATSASLSFWLHIDTTETTTATAYDKLTVLVQNTSGTTLATLATYSNLNKNPGYIQKTFDLSAYKGQTLRLKFNAVEDSSLKTSFVVDDVSLLVK